VTGEPENIGLQSDFKGARPIRPMALLRTPNGLLARVGPLSFSLAPDQDASAFPVIAIDTPSQRRRPMVDNPSVETRDRES
jgi:hypothetical protein